MRYISVNFKKLFSSVPILNMHAVEPGYNDNGLCETLSIVSDILRYKLIPICSP